MQGATNKWYKFLLKKNCFRIVFTAFFFSVQRCRSPQLVRVKVLFWWRSFCLAKPEVFGVFLTIGIAGVNRIAAADTASAIFQVPACI